MDPTIRLRIATRIHFALLRQYGQDVAISTLLGDSAEARQALRACEGSGNPELLSLVKQLKATPKPKPMAKFPTRGITPSAAPRSGMAHPLRRASAAPGFGASHPPQMLAHGSVLTRWLRGAIR